MDRRAEGRIAGTIAADELVIGTGVVVEEGVTIAGPSGPASKVVLGDQCFIGKGTVILVPELRVGDYTKLHARSFLHGKRPLQIGRNCWIGGGVVLDSMGGLTLDDNVGVGAQSQLWTHIQFGDIVEGSRFYSAKPMWVQKDVWFVGHCLVSPVHVGERAMALLGSLVTRDMLPNHVYAGVPAADVTEKVGPQFATRSAEEKAAKLWEIIHAWERANPGYAGAIRAISHASERSDDVTWFDVSTRTYNKRRVDPEIAFLKAHTPLIKFVPDGEPVFVTPPAPIESGSFSP